MPNGQKISKQTNKQTPHEKILTSQGKLTWVVNEKAIISTFKFSFKITIYISLKDTEDIYHLPHYGTC